MKIEIGGAFLDGQLIERHVALLIPKGAGKFLAPLRHGLVGPCIDQIEGDTRKDFCGEFEGCKRFVDRVLAAQCLEVRLIQGLHADGDAVDAGSAVAAEIFSFDGGGVGFERGLDIGRNSPVPGNGIEHVGHGFGRHQRWRAAAEEDRTSRCGPAFGPRTMQVRG